MTKSKQMVVVGGPNGSGKSTFIEQALKSRVSEYLGADQIAKELNSESPESVAIEAGRLFVERLRDRITRGENIIVESTLSGKSLVRQLEKATSLGYETIVMFIFLDSPATCVARVKHRVSRGGHHVPDADVYRRFGRSLKNFWRRYRFVTDQWMLHQNSSKGCVAVASGRADNYIVYNDELMQSFLAGAEV